MGMAPEGDADVVEEDGPFNGFLRTCSRDSTATAFRRVVVEAVGRRAGDWNAWTGAVELVASSTARRHSRLFVAAIFFLPTYY